MAVLRGYANPRVVQISNPDGPRHVSRVVGDPLGVPKHPLKIASHRGAMRLATYRGVTVFTDATLQCSLESSAPPGVDSLTTQPTHGPPGRAILLNHFLGTPFPAIFGLDASSCSESAAYGCAQGLC